jgi:hypothetical protein
VANVALNAAGAALLGVFLTAGQNAPDAVLTINVAADQATPADYQPLMVNSAPGGVYPRALQIPIGLGGYFPIPAECQNLPAKIQLQVQNAGAATNVSIVTSA